MSATRQVAEFVHTTRADAVPAPAKSAALRSRTDTACAARLAQPIEVFGLHAAMPGVWTSAVRSSAAGIGDTALWGTAGAVLWPALEAVAGTPPNGADDDRLADAFCVGVAVGEALWRAGRYREADRGFDGTSVFGAMAAAAACARYLRLSVDEVVAVLGIAASGTGGLLVNLGTDLEPVHAGMAATTAVRATRLGQAGFLAAPDILEARQGFAEAYFGPDTLDPDHLHDELSAALAHGHGVRLRRYPCHVEGQGPVSALAGLGRARRDISAVQVTGVAPTSGAVRFDVPSNAAQARASLRYVLTLALLRGTVSQAALDPGSADGTAALAAMDRVGVEIMSRWDVRLAAPAPPQLTVTMHDGTVVAVGLPEPDGSSAALTDKWARVCAELTESGDGETAARIAAIIKALADPGRARVSGSAHLCDICSRNPLWSRQITGIFWRGSAVEAAIRGQNAHRQGVRSTRRRVYGRPPSAATGG
jgi:2-methylcitrate dehydratase PrpD